MSTQSSKGNVLEGWAAAVERIQAKARAKVMAVQHWATYVLHSHLHRWRVRHASWMQYTRNCDLAVQLWVAHTKMHCMTSWIFYVHGRRLAEQWMHNVNIFLVRGDQKYLRGVLHQWHHQWQLKVLRHAKRPPSQGPAAGALVMPGRPDSLDGAEAGGGGVKIDDVNGDDRGHCNDYRCDGACTSAMDCSLGGLCVKGKCVGTERGTCRNVVFVGYGDCDAFPVCGYKL